MEVYVTLKEAAELEGIGYDTMQKKVRRLPEKFQAIMDQRESGGREQVKVAVSSLSRKARTAWKDREKLKEIAGETGQEETEPDQMPWFATVDPDWFMENHKKEWYKAVELGNVVREFMDYGDRGKSEYAEEFAQERLGKGKRTLYRYVEAYREAEAWADRLHKQDGCSYDFFKVMCLCRKPKEAGTFPSFTPEVKQAIKNIWFNKDFARNQGTREMLYDKLTALKEINGWEKIPSYQSVARYINHLMDDENMRNAWYLASRGEREYRNKVMTKGERNTKDLRVMEVVMGDEHTFDCWVAYTHPNGKVTAVKPKLAAWIDIRSRMVLGDVMCRDGNTEVLKESMLKMLYHDAGSVPRYIYIDNGQDYIAKGMTGYDRNDRQRIGFDDTAQGFYKSIGIEDFHRALPYFAWTKAQVERFFRTVCERFTRWFTSYTGTLTGSRTFAKVDKDIKGMLNRGELMTMEEFYGLWTRWLHEVYAVRKHRGLAKQGEEFTTPASCFENAERYMKACPPKRYATILMMQSRKCHVYNTGISMGGLSYKSDDLNDYIGRKVDVKYDPHDMKTLYVFYKGKQVCEAYAQELLDFASPHGVEQKALKDHMGMQKRQLRKDRKRLEENNIPFEEINEQYVGFNEVTGGINLMEGKKPKKAKVVQLPEDRTYRNGFRVGKKEEPGEESEYIRKKAEDAMKELRAL